ncbi:hypothetical protein JCM10212_003242 [Sporobolomyces blumeae]
MPLFGKSSSSSAHPPPSTASPYPPAHQLASSASSQPAYGNTSQYGHAQQQQQAYSNSVAHQQVQQHYHHSTSGGPPPSQGYAPPGSSPYHPSSQDPPLRAWFDAVDLDRSGYITQLELKQALVNGDWQPFDDQTVQMLMRIFDTDGNGTITFQEFSGLWQYIKEWQNVFRTFDRDHSGTIESAELANALSTFGYNLSPQLINLLQRKYNPSSAVKPSMGGPGGFNASRSAPGITFGAVLPDHPLSDYPTAANDSLAMVLSHSQDRFVRCCVTVRQLSESFKGVDSDRDGWVNISYETFMTMVLSAP